MYRVLRSLLNCVSISHVLIVHSFPNAGKIKCPEDHVRFRIRQNSSRSNRFTSDIVQRRSAWSQNVLVEEVHWSHTDSLWLSLWSTDPMKLIFQFSLIDFNFNLVIYDTCIILVGHCFVWLYTHMDGLCILDNDDSFYGSTCDFF